MLEIVLSNRFKKDLKLARKRGYNLELLDEIVTRLANLEPLPARNLDHERNRGMTCGSGFVL